ncbi:hypothetical protein C8F04DRAFT_946399 [Mycena alexandri]|uniref:CxC2-like cysteine cluster KDZ transposase-associated domain-containing protein n=1 Tax=Mycena alexandri TaxID=1745969 RepID=A0AAD6TCQ1_9AGAR|nr:hypothetical protein C8F04DRAFT_946399 [Mycena alexandri]
MRRDSNKNASQTDPMSEFPEVQQLFLNETVRLHGLGYSHASQHCALCGTAVGANASQEDGRPNRFFRCKDCGLFLQCMSCCLERHTHSPLHFLEEWNGEFWTRISLKSLGLVVQLGHEGFKCKRPQPAVRHITVVDTTGIHEVDYHFCGCSRSDHANALQQFMRHEWYPASKTDPDTVATFRVLDLFRLLNVVGNVNSRDFITALERLTDATVKTGLKWLPVGDRYKAFLLMSRQYAFLQRARRAARGHDHKGIIATAQGECMVKCWPCPHDGRNLAPNWRNVDPKYLYRLVLAMDANFKMKNRIRARERDDPSLGPGWGAFVEPKAYKKHLRGYVAEKDISTCIAFAALTQKDTRNTAGLRVSGVGGVVCARHECIRPNGLGDLQKGERYANMDYILLSAVKGFDGQELTLSYDIACQWKKNFKERMEHLPKELHIDLDAIDVDSGLPVWHALAHEELCAVLNSLNYIMGVGKTDGEGIERLWAFLNGCSYQTKEMGLGNRADTVEDKLDSHNFLKNLGQADSLRRKLIVAIAERARQVEAFKDINKTVPSEKRAEWQQLIDAFAADHSKPNPYMLTNSGGPTEAEIRALLKQEEQQAVQKGELPLHATSATAFLAGGLQLEETQRRIKGEIAGRHVTADRESKIQEYRLALLAKLRKFRELQSIYTPAAVRAIAAEEAGRDGELPPPNPEHIRLWLPSELAASQRAGGGCQHNVADMEARLREGQCSNALVDIRGRLHTKRYLINFRNDNLTGQKKTTRAFTIIEQLGDRVDISSRKYTDARTALTRLWGAEYAPHLRVLKPADLRLEGEESRDPGAAAASDRAAMKKLARAGNRGAQPMRSDASSSKTAGVSWIWISPGALDESEKDLHESLRVEWSRAKARKNRWDEEVELLREEMRRVLRYLVWETGRWERLGREAADRSDVTPDLRDGLRAYAAKQADMHRELGSLFQGEMGQTVEEATASAIASGFGADDEGLAPLFTQGTFHLIYDSARYILIVALAAE